MSIQTPLPQDVPTILRIAEGTGVFTKHELRVVGELLETYFNPKPHDDYEFLIYRNGDPNGVAGFACFGPTPLADRIWDFYWLGVDQHQQGAGVGKKLLFAVEDAMRERGARAVYLETSDSDAYVPARTLYERYGYERVAHFDDFYAPGEGKVIYRKVFKRE